MYRLYLCTLFVFSMLVAACGSTGTDGSGTGSTSAIGDAFCTKLEACGGLSDAKEMAECTSLMAAFSALGTIANSGAVDCISNSSCASLKAGTDTVLNECTGLNPGDGTCISTTLLEVCNNSNQCVNVDCDDVCKNLEGEVETKCVKKASGETKCMCSITSTSTGSEFEIDGAVTAADGSDGGTDGGTTGGSEPPPPE
ncbi:MAG TPA: hypothetical protein EYN06_10555 [Myxococcales bacterium]|nr:hypothetical protein [Myxococcales bacterium]HIN86913.1 hypothetical protein [Myxococcales bacterium]